jgi:hypothetical protein
MKKANGIVLSKPGKPDYRSPASFRIIVLLETVSKILERIVATRLAAQARSSGLLHPHQCGSLSGLGCFDAITTLTHEVRLLQAAKLKVTTLFLDIKGGFDNVNSNRLAHILKKGSTPPYIIAWVKSFLSNRQCRLVFQGAPGIFAPVEVGTPQGSPISPLLFVIYVAGLHPAISRGLSLSYVDDFTLTTASGSYRENIQQLQRLFTRMQRIGGRLGVAFSVPKTELMHWRTPKERSPVSIAPITINDMLFHPSPNIRWLGYWLTPTLSTVTHFDRRLGLAKGSFAEIRQLSGAGKGLSPWCNRKLALGLVLPILTYGADCFVPSASSLRKMDAFWHKVLRWTTNCFYSTPIGALHCEAALPPLVAITLQRRKVAALRLVCSSPRVNPATARLPASVATWDPYRSTESHRDLIVGIQSHSHPVSWSGVVKPWSNVLPLDALCRLILDNISSLDKLPLASPDLILPTPYEEPEVKFTTIKAAIRSTLTADWLSARPVPEGYGYGPSLTPHAFMGLPRFIAGRIHQMRSGKSYLAAHGDWKDADADPLCPYCEEEDESFDHAILHCPAKADERMSRLSGIDELGPDAPLWSSAELLLQLSRYISATQTGFPSFHAEDEASLALS